MSLHLVDIGVVIRFFVIAAPPRVTADQHLTVAPHIGAGVTVDDHVGQVHPNHVLGSEFLDEGAVRKGTPLARKLSDALDRLVVGDTERQHRIWHGTVWHLLVHGKHMTAPVAPCVQRLFGVHHDL